MTEPSTEARQTPEEMRALIGQRVDIRRDSRSEGIGVLHNVIAGDFLTGEYDEAGQPLYEHAEDKSLHYTDENPFVGEITISRRRGNAWHVLAKPAE